MEEQDALMSWGRELQVPNQRNKQPFSAFKPSLIEKKRIALLCDARGDRPSRVHIGEPWTAREEEILFNLVDAFPGHWEGIAYGLSRSVDAVKSHYYHVKKDELQSSDNRSVLPHTFRRCATADEYGYSPDENMTTIEDESNAFHQSLDMLPE